MYSLSSTLTAIKNQVQHKPVEIHDIYFGSQVAEDSSTLHLVNFYKIINFFSYIGNEPTQYIPLAMQRSGIKRTSTGEIENVNYQLDNVNKELSDLANQYDFRNKRMVTRLIFRDHLDSYADAKVVFDGFIQAVSFEQKKMQTVCVPKLGSLKFETGWPYQIYCNARFGDAYCTVDKTLPANKKTGTATGGTHSTLIDSTTLTQADDYWNNGIVVFTSGDNNGLFRKVVDFSNTACMATLDYDLDHNVAVGDTYTIYRGCNKTLSRCKNTYSNDANFHGFHSIPLQD